MEVNTSIVGSCVVLRESISLLLLDVQRSIAGNTHANRDLSSFSSMLTSLHLSVRAIESSYGRSSSIPNTLSANLGSVLNGCNHVVNDIRALLDRSGESISATGSMGGAQCRPRMTKLCTRLEAHKSAIQIALEMLLLMDSESSPRGQASQSDRGLSPYQQLATDQIFFMLREIRVLQFQVAQLSQGQNVFATSLQSFLEDISEYTESVYQDFDADSVRTTTMREAEGESSIEDFHSAKGSFADSSRSSLHYEREVTDTFELMPDDAAQREYWDPRGTAHLQAAIPNLVLPSSSSQSERSAWSYASVRLRISNRLYSFKTADDMTRNIISAIAFLDPAVRAVRLARQQGVVSLSDDQKAWIDQQITLAEQSMDRAASLVEPARIDLQTRAKVRFVRKVKLILRDSPRIQACFEQLSVAGAGLNAAANILYGNNEGDLSSLHESGEVNSVSGLRIPAPPYCLSWSGATDGHD